MLTTLYFNCIVLKIMWIMMIIDLYCYNEVIEIHDMWRELKTNILQVQQENEYLKTTLEAILGRSHEHTSTKSSQNHHHQQHPINISGSNVGVQLDIYSQNCRTKAATNKFCSFQPAYAPFQFLKILFFYICCILFSVLLDKMTLFQLDMSYKIVPLSLCYNYLSSR